MMIAMSSDNPTNRRVKLLEAEKKLDVCASIVPGNLQIMTAKLIARVNLGRYEDALEIVGGLLEENEGNLLFAKTKIELLAVLKKDDLIASACEDLRKISTEEEYILFEVSLLVSQNKRKEALQSLKQRLDLPEIALRWALLRLLSGEGSDGILDVLSGFDYDGPQWFAVGVAAEEKSDFAFAGVCYGKALKKNPEAPEILNNFAWCSIQLDDYDEEAALAAAKSAYELLPGAMEVLDTYAAVMIACGKQAECITLMMERERIVKKNPVLLYRLAKAYEKSGNADAATGVYRSLLTFSDSELPEGVRRAEIEGKIGSDGSCD